MPKSSDSMAAEAARKKPRDHQGILNSTLRVTVTEPNGKTLNIAVFKDRSFMLREESQEPEGLPTSKLHSNRANWLKFRTPRPNSEPAPSQRDCNAETSSARRRLETIALTAEETARPQEQDRSATANAAALAIAQSSTPPAARQTTTTGNRAPPPDQPRSERHRASTRGVGSLPSSPPPNPGTDRSGRKRLGRPLDTRRTHCT